jgi:hypothetical protein
MGQKPDFLTRRQLKAIPLLVMGNDVDDACKRAGIARNTYYRWTQDREFMDELDKARSGMVQEGLERLKNGFGKAVDLLFEVLEDKGVSSGVRVRSAEKIVDIFLRLRELEDVEGRLAEMERVVLERRVYR